MPINLSVPARINILGNPSDANEGDFATISAAVDLRAGSTIEAADGIVIETAQQTGSDDEPVRVEFTVDDVPLPYDGQLDLVKAAINRLHRFSSEFRTALAAKGGFRISTWTDVPRNSGLGGSSLFIVMTLAGLREQYELDTRIHNDYVIGELTQRAESLELGITCGFADRYVPLFGGIAYMDYRGKLYHKDIFDEPLVTYERLDQWAGTLPLVMVSTGIERDSGDVHGQMRPRYIEEHDEWIERGGAMPPMVDFMHGAWRTAWRGKAALLAGDWKTFGDQMGANHRLVDEMMTYCGFTDGAGQINNMLIEMALNNGALGAKLTGAGGGGSVFALTYPGEESKVVDAWEQAIAQNGLTAAKVFLPKISREGLIVERD